MPGASPRATSTIAVNKHSSAGKEPIIDAVTVLCLSCDETKPLAEFPVPAIGTVCTHKAKVCTDCWQIWLDTQLETTSALQISCAQCENVLHQNDIQAFASPPTFDRYLDNCIRLYISKDLNFRWCPYPSCTSGQVHDAGGQGNIFTCVTCERKSCVNCSSEWHAGRSCQEFKEEQAAIRQWEYLKEVDRRRRCGKISDATAETLMNRKGRQERKSLPQDPITQDVAHSNCHGVMNPSVLT